MTLHFQNIGLMGRAANLEVQSTLNALVEFLENQHISVFVDKECAPIVKSKTIKKCKATKLGEHVDLMIVVGGDGSFLQAARLVIPYDIPMIGVNRGRRGFLTDISPQAMTQSFTPLLQGKYLTEQRFFIEGQVIRKDKLLHQDIALNDIVLYTGDLARMIEFEVTIDQHFVYRQRSDGLITATPTGSTAYALSAGGPILHPSLEALTLVPMHPHSLTSRPIVLSNQSVIEINISEENIIEPIVSFDGQVHCQLKANDRIIIKRYDNTLRLLHPEDYDYYNTLRSKLNWSSTH